METVNDEILYQTFLRTAANGVYIVGIIRTMVAEMVPEKELQPVAFSLMPLVWSLGSIFGPAFGGFFAKPAQQFPWLFGGVAFWEKYPFFLPNLVAAVVFLVSITIAALFLRVCPSPHIFLPTPAASCVNSR